MEEVTLYVIETQEPPAQNIFRYNDELDATVAYFNAVAANYSALKAGSVEHFGIYLMNADLSIIKNEVK